MFCYAALGQIRSGQTKPRIDPTVLQYTAVKPAEKKDDSPSVLTTVVVLSAVGLALWALS